MVLWVEMFRVIMFQVSCIEFPFLGYCEIVMFLVFFLSEKYDVFSILFSFESRALSNH